MFDIEQHLIELAIRRMKNDTPENREETERRVQEYEAKVAEILQCPGRVISQEGESIVVERAEEGGNENGLVSVSELIKKHISDVTKAKTKRQRKGQTDFLLSYVYVEIKASGFTVCQLSFETLADYIEYERRIQGIHV